MKYAITYDIGKKKREDNGINEDSIAITLLQDGHRCGLTIKEDTNDEDIGRAGDIEPAVDGPGDKIHYEDDEVSVDESDKTKLGDDEINSDGVDDVGSNRGGIEVNEDTTEIYSTKDELPTVSDPLTETGPRDRYAGIFVLADGAGGEEAGDLASYIATTVITENLSGIVHRVRRLKTGGFGLEIDREAFGAEPSDQDIEAEITEAIETANREIIHYANEADLAGMYSTVVVGVYLDEKFHYAWVGDSRAYIINERHKNISLLTKDHAKVQRYEDEGKIDKIEGYIHPDGNEIDRAIGGRAGVDPETAQSGVETGTVQLFREDIVVLTSDGLIDAQTDYFELYRDYITSDRDKEVAERVLEKVVTDTDIRDIVLEEPTLDDAAKRFVDFSNEKGGKDNISLILFSGSSLPMSPDPSENHLPERALDPETELEDRKTIIKDQ